MNFEVKNGHDYIDVVKELFVEYVRSLGVAAHMKEFDGIEDKYKGEGEGLLIAFVDDKPAGCVAIRRINAKRAEMKRLYVKPEYRRTGLGMSLAKIVVDEAKGMGYQELALDTLPSMESAVQLYHALGFKRIDGNHKQPVRNVIHLTLPLQ